MAPAKISDVVTPAPISSPPSGRRRAPRISERLLWGVPTGLALLALVVTVVAPAIWLLVYSVRSGQGGGVTLSNYVDAFTDPLHLRPIWNSVKLGASVMVLCVAMGVPLAWLVSRTDLPGRGGLRVCVYASFILPSLLSAVSWVMLASPNAGLLNKLTESLFGVAFLNVFTMEFLAVVIAFSLFPYTFIFTISSLDTIGAETEEAAAIMGARPLRRALTVTLPLVTPAVLASMTVSFLQAVSLYGAPALIAVPAGEHVITTQLFLFFGFPRRPELAAAYGIPLVLLAAAFLYARRKIIGRRGYVTVGGKGSQRYIIRLGRWRWLAATGAWGLWSIAVLLPGVTLLYVSLVPRWTQGGFLFTLRHYEWLFDHGGTAIANTLTFSIGAATLCVLLGFTVAYLGERRDSRVSRLLSFLTTAPLVLPGIILGVGMFAAFSRPPLLLSGTGLILVIAFWGRFMPIALQNIQPAIASINPELEHASRIMGAGITRTLGRITAPLAGSAMVSAWIFSFVLSTHEISAALLLVSIDTQVLPTLVVNLYEQALYERIAAIGIFMVALTMVAVVLGRVLIGRQFLLSGSR
ncbi:iron ABC transporter permease [Pseudonocardia sp. MH-G8]|uniref:ABC transporter permease n=1 Tax=Pseudonocardia sp. MH-G8 TaxID=1854588 RepID=UPI00130472C3|nr:iron ABC transporter permease [Pseudonocardia sp. MH-G8]